MKRIKQSMVLVCLLFGCVLFMSSWVFSAPKILIPLSYKPFLKEGGRVIYESEVDAIPSAIFRCYLNKFLIPNGTSGVNLRYTVSENGNKASFRIIDLLESDAGRVTFKFTNIYGEGTSSTNLDVAPR